MTLDFIASTYWLPAVSVAPTPVTALLHAVAVVKAGAFATIRIIYYSFGTGFLKGTWAQYASMSLALFTILFGAVMAIKENHLKRRLAFSTVSNLSYIIFGATLMTAGGLTGALTHMLYHGLMKITLFMCAGAVLVNSGREYIQDMRGMSRVMPFTFAVFTLAALALTGVPPLIGFTSKWQLATAAAESGQPLAVAGVGVLVLSAIMTAIYLFTVVIPAYFMPFVDRIPSQAEGRSDPGLCMKLSLGLMAAVIVGAGFVSVPLIRFLKSVASGLL